jgi:hypothetical protein
MDESGIREDALVCTVAGYHGTHAAWIGCEREWRKVLRDHNLLSQAEPRRRARAKAKITVQSSEAKPYKQTAGPALMEIRLSETFV